MKFDEFLTHFDKVKSLRSGEHQAICPAHNDIQPSLHIKQGEDGRILLNCKAGCSSEAIVAEIGLTLADLFSNDKALSKTPPKEVATYDYQDEAGNLLFQVVRYEPKSFKQRHKGDNGKWIWSLENVRRVIYHLPEINRVLNDTVYWVEGEKDCDNLWGWGLIATTSPGGVNSWKPEYADYLSGKRVVIIPDNDTAGYECAKQVAKDLTGKARELKSILLPAKDISDWLATGGKVESLPSLEQDISVLLNPKKQVEVTQTITGFKFHWVKEQIIINVSRIRSHTDGRITGSIQLILQSISKTEPSFSWNFSSSQTRKQLVNSLKEKHPEWKWQEIIDELCSQVQSLALGGEPIKELWTSENIKGPEYLLEPILIKDLPTIIFGEKGVTKSNLALVLYILLTLPWDDNLLELGAPNHSVKTAFLDWELPGSIAQWNLKKLQEGLNLPPLPLYHRRCHSPLADDIETIQKYLIEIKAEAVIIDSLGRACGGDLVKDTENVNRFFTALDKLKVTSLILAQTAKPEAGKSRKGAGIYGSTFFSYYARSIWELCKAESIGEDEISVALFHRSANLTKLQKPMGFRFDFNENKTTIGREAVSYSEFLEKVNRQAQIIELLNIKPLTTQEIMEALDIKRSNADVTLKKLRDRGKIVKTTSGQWGLRVEAPNEIINGSS